MSLVAYGSSDDESSDEEVKPAKIDSHNESSLKSVNTSINATVNLPKDPSVRVNLPAPKNRRKFEECVGEDISDGEKVVESRLGFHALPKPRDFGNEFSHAVEDDDVPLFKPKQPVADVPMKKDRPTAKISIPLLSEFKDVDEDLEQRKNKPGATKKGSGLFSILPPPKNEILPKKNNLIPHVLTKSITKPVPDKIPTKPPAAGAEKPVRKVSEKDGGKMLPMMDYDSNSEDDDEDHQDFFSLSKTIAPKATIPAANTNFFTIPHKEMDDGKIETDCKFDDSSKVETVVAMEEEEEEEEEESRTRVSTVMNLPRDEILLKNRAEVGPKLPVPEQEFNVDAEGNVAFDEKAIEYLCGKRGVKRKNKMIEEAEIIEINGEDMKPDEREWLVKAMTEEQVQRPVSMQGAGPSSQSKKKHQITYLAHQAKAMEVELKNTWSQNRMARKQTQSKYGF